MKAYKVKAVFPSPIPGEETQTRETVMRNFSTILTSAEASVALAEQALGARIVLTLLQQELDSSKIHIEYKFPTGETYLIIDCEQVEIEHKAPLAPPVVETPDDEEDDVPEETKSIYNDWLRRARSGEKPN